MSEPASSSKPAKDSSSKVKLSDLALGAIMGCIFTLAAFALINWLRTPSPPPPPAIEVDSPEPMADGVFRLKAKTRNGEPVVWIAKDGPGEQVISPLSAHECIWSAKDAKKQGVYRLLAVASIDGEVDPCMELVEILVGPRPPPGPGPGPEPEPLDEFQQKLKAALAADHGKDKAEDLAALLIQAGKKAKVFSGTLAQFQGQFAAAAKSLIGSELSIVRGIMGEYMNANLPRDATKPMDAATRQKVHDVFTYLGQSLDKVRQ